jgi:hypothetical protein
MEMVRPAPLRIIPGVCGAICGAVLALGLVVLLFAAYLVVRLGGENALDLFWSELIYMLKNQLGPPLTGCGLIGAATGWASCAPRGRYSIAWSLVLVALLTSCLWLAILSLNPPTPRLKGDDRPSLGWTNAVLLVASPFAVALVLSLLRARQPHKDRNAEQSLAAESR